MVNQKKLASILNLVIIILFMVLINQLAFRYFTRIDLTEDQRYTIKEPTKELLGRLDDVVYVEVYLTGELPAGFERFKKGIAEMLKNFQVYAGKNIQYKFVDPSIAQSTQARNAFYRRLVDKGIQPTNLFDNENGSRVEKLIFPGALVSYGGTEVGVNLLKGNRGETAEEKLNTSIEGLEYELASAIKQALGIERPKIGILNGHGEADSVSIAGVSNLIAEKYDVIELDLTKAKDLSGFDAVLGIQPKSRFDESDLFKLDQYLVTGGNLLLFVDAVNVNIDSAGNGTGGTIAVPVDLNLTPLLFKHGLRINNNLIQDLNAGSYPVVVGNFGQDPQIKPLQWPYFPLFNNYTDHEIVKGLDVTEGKFVSTIDTVASPGIKKNFLIYSSQYSRALNAPLPVDINDMRDIVEENFVNQIPLPVAALNEGSFTSMFANRFLPEGINKSSFVSSGEGGKLLVMGDGDFLINDIGIRQNRPLPVGFDQFTQTQYANGEFLMNALSYMIDDQGIILAKNKEIKIRPLNKVKVENEKGFWQLVNLALPLILIILFGIIKAVIRKNKYTRFGNGQ
ncbi:gliding motility-associated ABC transporter substrate-binding protein GldG [Marinigracilibium pacificum]|uniref:Gliding motility-associated ABC transporter substrate-binding protein GldG n=1 Tax=Marinigracilibium pacificum TaxID=2729599 RepID=A0A848J3L3_9BACT|nr:gliding motility-associated ABC transporter substrate-binding protein GldG [Marinigracilibium pacificum]NMM50095.1 gliding motility-associated ABC transporter substrate-binding protein GldG [Marinigracilibium pacificum]